MRARTRQRRGDVLGGMASVRPRPSLLIGLIARLNSLCELSWASLTVLGGNPVRICSVSSAVFAIPEGLTVELGLAPRLESWERRDDPAQVALREFVSRVYELIDPLIDSLDGPLAFHLHVGLPPQFDPLWERDLDNYLFPIARSLPERVVAVWGTKGRGALSTVRLEKAVLAGGSRQMLHVPRSRISGSVWKAAVQDAVEQAEELPEGPVALELAYTVGPDVNWPSLWKPSFSMPPGPP
jgi:hypothetical protein